MRKFENRYPRLIPEMHYYIVELAKTKERYGISKTDLMGLIDLEPFLYFTLNEFKDVYEICSWEDGRLNRFLEEGWVEKLNNKEHKQDSRNKDRYYLSQKTKRMIRDFYTRLSKRLYE